MDMLLCQTQPFFSIFFKIKSYLLFVYSLNRVSTLHPGAAALTRKFMLFQYDHLWHRATLYFPKMKTWLSLDISKMSLLSVGFKTMLPFVFFLCSELLDVFSIDVMLI